MSNTSVACPGETVLFTYFGTGTALRWQVNLPAEFGLIYISTKCNLPWFY